MSGDASTTYVPFQTRLREGDVTGLLAGVEWDEYDAVNPAGGPITLVTAIIGRTHVKAMITRTTGSAMIQVDQHASDAEARECHAGLVSQAREMAVMVATHVAMQEITDEYGDELGII